MGKIQWQYWNYDAGVPTGTSKTHIESEDGNKTLCGIQLVSNDTMNHDSEEGDGTSGYCKRCEKIEERENK